jgi:hypothetical protein
MVSVHNTSEFHNYIYDIEPQVSIIHKNTMLDYIHIHHYNIFKNIEHNLSLYNRLNSTEMHYTFFMVADEEGSNKSLDYLYDGIVDLEKDSILISENGTAINIMDGKVNNVNVIVKDIKCENGMINIINKKFSIN